MRTSSLTPRAASWALLSAALLMGGALIATVWSTHRGVTDASAMLERGQAGIVQDGVRMRLAELEEEPTSADLAAILTDMEAEGLRYLAAVDRSGSITAEAGEPAGARSAFTGPRARRSAGQSTVGDRIRLVLRRWPRPFDRRAWRGQRDRPRRPAFPRRTGPFVIEFQPRVAAELRAASRQTLAVGALAAGGLLLGALVLVRWMLHRAELERRLEHERRLASLGEMSAVMAHEIRNPLASLKGNAQLLARALPEGERPRARADRVVDEAIRLESLTNDLLEFARTGAIRREPVDPAPLLREAAAELDAARVDIAADRAPAVWPLDPARIRQVLGNLLENALQASEGRVTASAREEDGRLVYTVRDDGPGIPPEDLPHIFEPFYTRRTRGTGLGLAVARRLVDLHGGTLTARNHPDGGAELRVSIPRS